MELILTRMKLRNQLPSVFFSIISLMKCDGRDAFSAVTWQQQAVSSRIYRSTLSSHYQPDGGRARNEFEVTQEASLVQEWKPCYLRSICDQKIQKNKESVAIELHFEAMIFESLQLNRESSTAVNGCDCYFQGFKNCYYWKCFSRFHPGRYFEVTSKIRAFLNPGFFVSVETTWKLGMIGYYSGTSYVV